MLFCFFFTVLGVELSIPRDVFSVSSHGGKVYAVGVDHIWLWDLETGAALITREFRPGVQSFVWLGDNQLLISTEKQSEFIQNGDVSVAKPFIMSTLSYDKKIVYVGLGGYNPEPPRFPLHRIESDKKGITATPLNFRVTQAMRDNGLGYKKIWAIRHGDSTLIATQVDSVVYKLHKDETTVFAQLPITLGRKTPKEIELDKYITALRLALKDAKFIKWFGLLDGKICLVIGSVGLDKNALYHLTPFEAVRKIEGEPIGQFKNQLVVITKDRAVKLD